MKRLFSSLKRFWQSLVLLAIGFCCLATTVLAMDQYKLPGRGEDVIGSNYWVEVKKKENITKIRHGNQVSYDELVSANSGVDFNQLRVGQKILIPKRFILPPFRKGIVVNIPELRLYFFNEEERNVYTCPVGLGRDGWRTPVFSTKVIGKKANPTWTPPKSIRDYTFKKTGRVLPDVVPGGPNNPLGLYALYLGVPTYAIHGTNAVNSVGAFISSGCVRLAAPDIKFLYENVPVGTPVYFIYHPIKAGWHENKLYLESHRIIDDYTDTKIEYNQQKAKGLKDPSARQALYNAIENRPAHVFEKRVEEVLDQRSGVPEIIGYESE